MQQTKGFLGVIWPAYGKKGVVDQTLYKKIEETVGCDRKDKEQPEADTGE